MNKTKIEWIKNPDGTQGYTWNPITGCLNGCSYCYARKLANGRLKPLYLANKNVAPTKPLPNGGYHTPVNIRADLTLLEVHRADPFYPRFWDLRLIDPYAIKKPCGIFTVDMGELFGSWIPENWQEKIFAVIKSCPQHRFYLLTKQPQNLIKFSPFPDNYWVGVTATHYKHFENAVWYLSQIEATVRFISLEPLLSRIPPIDDSYVDWMRQAWSKINWIIIGAQTKPYKPPKIEWVQEIVEAADKAGVKVFLKDNLEALFLEKFPPRPFENFGCWNLPDWAIDKKGKERGLLKLRQEMPK